MSTISWPDLLLELDERPAPFEVGPWINFGGGFRSQFGGTTTASAVGTGAEGTFRLHADTGNCAGHPEQGPCPAWLPRLGPWATVEASERLTHPHVDGGLAFDLGGPRARSFSTFGARVGLGRGKGATEIAGQLSWGLRFVRMRSQAFGSNGPCRTLIAPVTGLRLYAAARRAIEGGDALTVTFGVEWRPFGRGLGLME